MRECVNKEMIRLECVRDGVIRPKCVGEEVIRVREGEAGLGSSHSA